MEFCLGKVLEVGWGGRGEAAFPLSSPSSQAPRVESKHHILSHFDAAVCSEEDEVGKGQWGWLEGRGDVLGEMVSEGPLWEGDTRAGSTPSRSKAGLTLTLAWAVPVPHAPRGLAQPPGSYGPWTIELAFLCLISSSVKRG